MLKVVSNSSVLIHLAKIGKLNLLEKFYKNIIIPEAVYKECVIEGGNQEDAKLIKEAKWIKVKKIKENKLVKVLNKEFDKGEAEAIVLSLEIGSNLILLDDFEAREKARLFGLKITGTLGILLRAKYNGEINSLREEMIKLKQIGFRISDELEYKLLQEAKEL